MICCVEGVLLLNGVTSVSEAKFSAIINESQKGFFPDLESPSPGRSFSTFLFTIVGEPLSRMIQVASDANLVVWFKPTLDSLIVTHLQFVDNTLIFCAAEEDQNQECECYSWMF